MTDALPPSPATPDERNRSIGRAFISHSTSNRIVGALDSIYGLQGSRHFGQIVAIQGTSHVGKSTALDFWMIRLAEQLGGITENLARNQERVNEAANVSYVTMMDGPQRIHPVIRIQIIGNPTFRALGDDTLRGLVRGRPDPWKNGGDLASALTNKLVAFRTKLVIYEDIQELAKVKGARANEAVVLLRALCKVARVEVAAVGTEGTFKILKSENETQKLVADWIELSPLAPPDFEKEKPGEFVTFLSKLKKKLLFPKESPLDEKQLALMLWSYCGGVIGEIKSLMQSATDTATRQGWDCIDRTALRKHLELKQKKFGRDNPFFLPGDE
ncbi:TniB family NTP-binding protein [Devosia sp. FJ2-5-3]|uniref:TniB family NTP-binding protein n=1 Tax=Devosia sp. FJ2-5-3 TaxID=2976680 RepID=UPI0023D7DA6C|nr:TniB family NTP-binding protein [Devosia sp. FJ2-5-3]WEJ56715.1 TniB family NTP-binding protein [Devosia sp. FJ2-5-3]